VKILVQKFGGTSVANRQLRQAAAEHVEDALKDDYSVVVVVSAMGRRGDPYATDSLLGVVDEPTAAAERDLDILMSCGESISAVVFASLLRSRGHEVVVFNGPQAGIITNDDYGNARILEIRTGRILEALNAGKVVVVTGFQGMTLDGDITTLGRGGSDTTATALGVALDAEYVDIFTDVEGIMTADPRIIGEAHKLHRVTYGEICNMAYQGAKVIHPRAVELAMQKNIPVRVRSTQSKDPGTLVTNAFEVLEKSVLSDRYVTAITQSAPVVQLQVRDSVVPQTEILNTLAAANISLDVILVSPGLMMFTVAEAKAKAAEATLERLGVTPKVVRQLAKVSAVGAGMTGVPGVMARVVAALASKEVEVLQSSDSHTSISVIVPESKMSIAVRALHDAFALHESEN